MNDRKYDVTGIAGATATPACQVRRSTACRRERYHLPVRRGTILERRPHDLQLVVESTGLRDGGWLDVNGAPLTDAARIIERFRRVDYGNIKIQVTVDDPKAYSRLWTTAKMPHRLLPGDELIEFVCGENEQSSQHFSK
ncbi:MAG: hypothetical protein C5B57_02770 [Blastocatellia bacterium]|nr:MAG: hypothetical protein C5B57_02770 [Blastocatellia bacterium]